MAWSVSRWCRTLACSLALAGPGLPAHAEGPLKIVTEEFPPYSMTQNGKVTGLATDVLQAVLKEVNMQGNIQSMPWARAYEVAQGPETVLIYSITRTPVREKLFKWIGVIAPADWCLFSLQSRHLALNRLEEAKSRQVATVNQDVGEQFLVSKGFAIGQNLQSSAKYEFNYEKLKLGRVDLWVSNALVAAYLARRLVLATVGFCMLFALVTVAVRTWSAWHGNVSAMRGKLDLLDQVYQRPLSKAIWEMDRDLLKTHVASAANVAAIGRMELKITLANGTPEVLQQTRDG